MRDVVADLDPQGTHEWLDALEAVVRAEGPERARYLLDTLIAEAQRKGAGFNHLFRANNDRQPGDLVYIQGHSSPGAATAQRDGGDQEIRARPGEARPDNGMKDRRGT